MEKLLYKIVVIGRVQGVGFRHSALTMARYAGIRGFIRNESDGTVYIEAEGSRNQLDEFIVWCRKGTGLGNVESLRITTSSPANYSKFIIKY